MKFERVCQGVCLAIAISGLAGCAGTTSALHTESKVVPFEIRFAAPGLEEEMTKIGLASTFKVYWQSHRDRKWSLRYSLENLKQNVSEKFYVAYYDRAWSLKNVTVRSVVPNNQTTSISIALTLENPETAAETVFEAIEVWTLVGGKWMHEVSDPMLVGTKQ